jgi:hypothetical protein
MVVWPEARFLRAGIARAGTLRARLEADSVCLPPTAAEKLQGFPAYCTCD